MTGEQRWRFYTVPGDPSQPFESKAMETAAKSWDANGGNMAAEGPHGMHGF
jgi:quinohemoprotein ethanol dehydrogenase